MGECEGLGIPKAVRASRSIATVRSLVSDQDVMGGLIGISCTPEEVVEMVMDVKDISTSVGFWAAEEERCA